MLHKITYWFKGLFVCRVYVATRMTNRSRGEMIKRAKLVSRIFAKAGVEAISPVLREKVRNKRGVLKNTSKLLLYKKWTGDKDILAWECHGMAWDGANDKSIGCEREYGLARFLWWKPIATIVPEPQTLTVAKFEDDLISGDVEAVAHYFATVHGNLYKRWKWRLLILNRSFPKFLFGQLWQWLH